MDEMAWVRWEALYLAGMIVSREDYRRCLKEIFMKQVVIPKHEKVRIKRSGGSGQYSRVQHAFFMPLYLSVTNNQNKWIEQNGFAGIQCCQLDTHGHGTKQLTYASMRKCEGVYASMRKCVFYVFSKKSEWFAEARVCSMCVFYVKIGV